MKPTLKRSLLGLKKTLHGVGQSLTEAFQAPLRQQPNLITALCLTAPLSLATPASAGLDDASVESTSDLSALSTLSTASLGYIYGFPLVLMGETRDGLTGPERSCTFGADTNRFTHVLDIPDSSFKAVVRPNVDTLYSSAMLDLASGPVRLDMPAVPDRYVLMTLLDAWSNNFAGVGTQSHGDDSGHYLIVGPDWAGSARDRLAAKRQGLTILESPTNLVWIIGRTEVRGEDDIPAVNAIQQQYQLTPPLVTIQQSTNLPHPGCVEDSEKSPPIDVVTGLSGEAFFTRLDTLMRQQPAPTEDAALVSALARIGVGPDANFHVSELSARQKRQLDRGLAFAQASIDEALGLLGLGGWGPDPRWVPLGDFGRRYFIRALVAQVGFGANKAEYAIYQNTERDSDGERLHGKHTYVFRLDASDLPPTRAFWSMTLYGDDGFLRDSDAAAALGHQAYAVSDLQPLTPDEHGFIDVYISAIPPEGVPLENWLPAPNEPFQLTLRFYDPDDTLLNNQWDIPEPEKR
ncbi:MAG: DUF1254 domain-containing protein [Pseudomonadota bacterium]|nr:DUF1254 domain-containing protein [Pseudomonadota bacterium]